MSPLTGTVALVAGATRGAGRGVARMLGEAGATVYCTGRSTRGHPPPAGHPYAGRPETIEETAELVSAQGGNGIAVRCDHTVESEVAALFTRVRREQKGLDILVNVLTGSSVNDWQGFTKLPLAAGRAMVESWVWPHVYTCWHAIPLLRGRRPGLIVTIIEGHTIEYRSQLFYDLAVNTLKRLMLAIAHEEGGKVTALALAPGFMRTEAVLDQLGATEATWQAVAQTSKVARQFGFAGSETPCFGGRAVVALAQDPALSGRNGGVFSSWDLAETYGFTDIDGNRPHWGRYGAEHFPHIFAVAPKTTYWEQRFVQPTPGRRKAK